MSIIDTIRQAKRIVSLLVAAASVPDDLEELLPLAERGNAKAQFKLGMKYADGVDVDLDHEKAAVWYRKAAEQGYAEAQMMLGICYSQGEGVPEDLGEAAVWLRKAAEQGHPDAREALRMLEEAMRMLEDTDETNAS